MKFLLEDPQLPVCLIEKHPIFCKLDGEDDGESVISNLESVI